MCKNAEYEIETTGEAWRLFELYGNSDKTKNSAELEAGEPSKQPLESTVAVDTFPLPDKITAVSK